MSKIAPRSERTRTRQIEIDGQKLKREIEKRGLTAKQISEEIGYSSNAVSRYIRDNECAKSFLAVVEVKYNISLDDIKLDKKEEPVVQTETIKEVVKEVTVNIDYEKLAEIIENAVYKAVSKAWNEPLTATSPVKKEEVV